MNRREFLSLLSAWTIGTALATEKKSAFQLQQPSGLYHPTRYAFVADMATSHIGVVDIVSGENIDYLSFDGFRPRVIQMARDDAMMAIGSPEHKEIIFFNLFTRETTKVPLPAPVYQIFFIPQSKWVAIGLQDQVGLINYHTFEVKIFPEKFDSDKRKTFWNTYYSLLFSSFSQSFWILDEEQPKIYHKFGTDPIEKEWKTYDLSNRVKSGLGVGVASPEDYMLAFTTDNGSEGLIYFPAEDKLLSTGEMYKHRTTAEPMIMPYIDAYSGRVVFADTAGNVALFDFTKGDDKPQKFKVDFAPIMTRTGWLERTWILGGDRGLLLQDFDNPDNKKLYTFPYQVKDMWVTGDSKTLLYTVDEGVSAIHRIDIRSKEQLPSIRLYNVVMGEMIRMGSNNSICY